MNVLFHANASKAIGAGHLMRSLALAQALAGNGQATWLVTCPESAPGLIAPWKTLGAKVAGSVSARTAVVLAGARELLHDGQVVVVDGDCGCLLCEGEPAP